MGGQRADAVVFVYERLGLAVEILIGYLFILRRVLRILSRDFPKIKSQTYGRMRAASTLNGVDVERLVVDDERRFLLGEVCHPVEFFDLPLRQPLFPSVVNSLYHRAFESALVEEVGHGGAMAERVDRPADLGRYTEITFYPLMA